MLVFKPIDIDKTIRVAVALRKEAKHDSGETTDSFCAEKTVFHFGQLGEVDAVRSHLHIVEVLVRSDAQIGHVVAQLDFPFTMTSLA